IFTSGFLQPDFAFLDSRMTLTLPPAVTAATGMDALTHAMEAYYCLQKNPLSDAHALLAIKLIKENLLATVKNGADKESRLALATASNLAGIAFANSMVGMVHTLGHSFGALCGVPHGICMAILLPYGLEYNMHKSEEFISQMLLPLVGATIYQNTPKDKRGEMVVSIVRQLNQDLHDATGGKHALCFKDMKNAIGEQLVKEDALPEIAKIAQNDGSIFMNPEDLDFDDLLMVAECAWSGTRIDVAKIKR
ncbi:MAG: iron-containing alcohol dehydrogenase, partial [Deltaproteobacteria bacterium]